ncbi:MAG: hypothetical protein H6710_09370 [Myxococcales bacterium]|nr:hypothetical protein [Myxococcales bacterium]
MSGRSMYMVIKTCLYRHVRHSALFDAGDAGATPAPGRAAAARALPLALALACAIPPEAPADEPAAAPALESPDDLADPPLRSPCPGSDQAFAARAIRLIQGRRPTGVRETRLLAAIIAELDARGLPGRALVARGLADGPRYRARWRGALLDLLRVPRLGASADLACYGHQGPLAADPGLAAFVRDHPPGDARRPRCGRGRWPT